MSLTYPDLLRQAAGTRYMRMVLILPGDRHGTPDAEGRRPFVSDEPMVEFYDTRFAHDPEHGGQFVSRYYAETLLSGLKRGGLSKGLLLDGRVSGWDVAAPDIELAMAWVEGALAAAQQPAT